MGFLFTKRSPSPCLWRRDLWLSVDITVALVIISKFMLVSRPVVPIHKYPLYISKSTLASWSTHSYTLPTPTLNCSGSQISLPETHTPYYNPTTLTILPIAVSIPASLTLVVCSLCVFLSALDTSRCFWMFSFVLFAIEPSHPRRRMEEPSSTFFTTHPYIQFCVSLAQASVGNLN